MAIFDNKFIFNQLKKEKGKAFFDGAKVRSIHKLMQNRGREFTNDQISVLVDLILNYTDRQNKDWIERCRYHSLNTMKKAGMTLSDDAEAFIEDFLNEYPEYNPEKNKVEPPKWPDLNSTDQDWLVFVTEHPERQGRWDHQEDIKDTRFINDNWSDLCAKDPCRGFKILSKIDVDVAPRWKEALVIWARQVHDFHEGHQTDLKLNPADVLIHLNQLPNAQLYIIANEASYFVKDAVRVLVKKEEGNHDKAVITFLERSLAVFNDIPSYTEDDNDTDNKRDAVTNAINSACGAAAEIAIFYQIAKSPKYADGIDENIKPVLQKMLYQNNQGGDYARTEIALRAVDFYLWDKKWSDEFLIPLFNHQDDNWSASLWSGYLHNPQWTPDFFSAIKDTLLKLNLSAQNRRPSPQRFANLLMNIFIYGGDLITQNDLRNSIERLEKQHHRHFLDMLIRHSEAAEQKKKFFENKCKPFFNKIWPYPHDSDQHQKYHGQYFEIIMLSGGAFNEAVGLLKDKLGMPNHNFLRRIENFLAKGELEDRPIQDMNEDHVEPKNEAEIYNYARRFPDAAVELFLALKVDKIGLYKAKEIHDVLFQIYSQEGFRNNPNYKRLKNLQVI